ncbi:MAG: sel1 repeat family protein [Betaproteobacteria bacterium]|nr:sel1 repeat family protein [Betaproteobacteria bacterium]MDE2209298.1 sel1 repeat family protein [Betaproteobacteria bacterium]
MPDILISYAREDEAAAARLRDALAGQGWDVWGDAGNDDRAGEGPQPSAAIGDALNAVKCVIVLWSGAAIGSKAVRLGARVARLAGKLVPVRIDGSEIPSELREGRPANLSEWAGDIVHPEFRRLTQALEERARGRRGEQAVPARSPGRWRASALATVALLAVGIALGYGIAQLGGAPGRAAPQALRQGLKAFFDGKYVEAEAELRSALRAGNGAAGYYLARMYRDGLGVHADPARALRWAEEGAARGNALAQNMVGLLEDAGHGLRRDDKAALASYLAAADQGLAWGAFNAGYFYESGRGRAQPDASTAFEYYRRAADDGNAAAGNAIGDLYRTGRGVPQDRDRAAQWYRWAADRGSAAASLSLGYMYANGQGVRQDDGEAVELYQHAARQQLPGALNNLGYMYEYGRGVPMDLERAASYYRRAVERGDKPALSNLGRALDKIKAAAAAASNRR